MRLGKVRRSGDSLALTIPKEEAERLGLSDGDTVAYQVRKAVLRPVLPPDEQAIVERIVREHRVALDFLASH